MNRGVRAPEGAREWFGQMQQQSFQRMVQESINAYMQMFNTPHSYLQEGMHLAQEDVL